MNTWNLLALFQHAGVALFLYVLPGLAVLTWLWRGDRLGWAEQLGLAAGLSIALYPLLLLWAYVLGLAPGSLFAWGPGTLAVVALTWRARSALAFWTEWRRWRPTWHHLPDVALLVLIPLLFGTRLLPIRSMVAPAWGDSVQHTFIVQLLLDNGGLFQSWQPYAPMQSFTYHYGFHTAAALWGWLTGLPGPDAVLATGQALNVLAVLALYPLALRLTGGNRWAGVAAVLIAGMLSPMPAFYVNWGRYTQLAGQVILPAAIWTVDLWWISDKRPDNRLLLLVTLLFAGLALTHYRIAMIGAVAVVGWTLWALWHHRDDLREWLSRAILFGSAALLAGLLIVPWAFILQSGRLITTHVALAKGNPETLDVRAEMRVWHSISSYIPRPLWIGSLGALMLALWKRRRLVVPLVLWSALAFFLTNPFLLNLPGTGWITNFALIIGVYIPVAIVLGWLLGVACRWIAGHPFGYVAIIVGFLGLTAFGMRQRLEVVNPFFQMMTPADVAAFDWIEAHVSEDATFLINGFLAYGDTSVVGSDAGWWLPFYTRRANTIPPLLYGVERLPSPEMRSRIRQLEIDVRTSNGDPASLRRILCQADVTHVYLGHKRGRVGFGAQPLIPETWLTQNDDFTLLYEEERAQVWHFDRTRCP